MRRTSALFLAALLVVTAVGCGGSGGSGGADADDACGPVRREPLDKRFLVHVLGNAPEPSYSTEPPTSGPHTPTPPVEPVQGTPLRNPVLVGLLEEGKVVLVHSGLSPADRTSLEAMAGEDVVVAPIADLPDDATVMALAWLTKQSCTSLHVPTLTSFVETHSGKGPGGDG